MMVNPLHYLQGIRLSLIFYVFMILTPVIFTVLRRLLVFYERRINFYGDNLEEKFINIERYKMLLSKYVYLAASVWIILRISLSSVKLMGATPALLAMSRGTLVSITSRLTVATWPLFTAHMRQLARLLWWRKMVWTSISLVTTSTWSLLAAHMRPTHTSLLDSRDSQPWPGSRNFSTDSESPI